MFIEQNFEKADCSHECDVILISCTFAAFQLPKLQGVNGLYDSLTM